MVTEWPGLNSLAWLRLPCCGAEHPTRVEDMSGDDCVIAAPVAPHTEPVRPPRDDDGFFIGWVGNGEGALEAPVLLVEQATEPMPTWTVRSIGPATKTQRRQYVRMQYKTEVSLYLSLGDAETKATTLDVSEGGIRVQLDNWAPDPGGRIFEIALPFEDDTFFLHGQKAWWGNLDENDIRIMGIRFHEIEQQTADSIRKHIFAAQLEERRRRLE